MRIAVNLKTAIERTYMVQVRSIAVLRLRTNYIKLPPRLAYALLMIKASIYSSYCILYGFLIKIFRAPANVS
jgi:hypothetical protein